MWYCGVGSGHLNLQRDTHSRRQWKQSCWAEKHHNSASSLNLTTIDNLEHVALMAIILGCYPLVIVKELTSTWKFGVGVGGGGGVGISALTIYAL